tara:strand:+ start:735 stop:2153 length:1419 start_codon:yes stop_codon:yes gene_type:complete
MIRHYRLSRIEAGRLSRLAWPILGAQLAQMGMGTLDVAMSGHVDATALAAVSIGSSVWLPIMVAFIGILMGLTPIVAQHVGARDWAAVRPALHQALWVAGVFGTASAVGLYLASDWLLALFAIPPEVAALAGAYLRAVAFGLPAVAAYETLRFYSDALGHTRASLLFALLGLGVNAVANAVLIFGGPGLVAAFGPNLLPGLAGLPALGAVGCGIATTISMWTMLIGLFVYTRWHGAYAPARIGPAWHAPAVLPIGEQLRIGVPIGVSLFSEVSLFTAITLLLAGYGEIVVSAHTVALNFSALLFMLPLSLGMALTVRVGQARGRAKFRHARFIAFNALALAMGVALVLDAILIFGGPYAVGLYTDNTAVRQLAVQLLLIATIYQFSDAAQVALAGALRGYKDTRVLMWVTLVAYWPVGLGSGHLLAAGVDGLFTGLGVYGYWIGLIAGLSVAAMLLLLRLTWVSRPVRRQPI